MSAPQPDRDSSAWWTGLNERRLLLQRCDNCHLPRIVPRAMCNSCSSFDWTWADACGAGTVISWTVSHRSHQADRTAPYVVLLVRLAEGANLMLPGGWAGDATGSDLIVGMPVVAGYREFRDANDETFVLLDWQRA